MGGAARFMGAARISCARQPCRFEVLEDGEVIDAMERITIPLPVWAIMRILGIEDRYREDLRRWSDSSNASLGGKLSAERWLEVERDILVRALERHRCNRTAAGASLGLSLRQMRYRMARLHVMDGADANPDGERGNA